MEKDKKKDLKMGSKEKGKRDDDLLLLKKSKHGLLRMLFGRTGVALMLIALQVFVLVRVVFFLESLVPYLLSTIAIFTFIMVVHVANTDTNADIKLAWILLITLLPGFGGLLYLFIRSDLGHRQIKKRLEIVLSESAEEFSPQEKTKARLKEDNRPLYNLGHYMEKVGGYPIYEGSTSQYFPSGESAFEEIIQQIKKAKSFIFLEFFIIDEGIMWGQILKILADKAKEGVEVRLLYDGTCEFFLLPHTYPKKLEALGIKTKVFAPIRPFLSTHYNYRDHRKILVVDGQVAFTGGINLADEYINAIEVYGHWKDVALMVQGPAVDSLTLSFLQMWNMTGDTRSYLEDAYRARPLKTPEAGYILPYADNPLDKDQTGQMVYMDIIDRAQDYVYIMTPYLILDSLLARSLAFAAERGVQVILITPHIPDKKLVFAQTRSHYASLLAAGVEVYEYIPGFMHAKVFLSDDKRAVVGTINLDYRSLYHHFECAVYLEDTPSLKDVKKDFIKTIDLSLAIDQEEIKKFGLLSKIMGRLLKLLAPMM